MTRITIITEGQKNLQSLLELRTQCTIQHNGYPCNSCFHAMILPISEDRLHELWLATLLYRGDYTITEIPMTKEVLIDRIYELVKLLTEDLEMDGII